jgi:L-alanine-DL-glutamate epimerase-like enolase superfamily enzyme
MKIASIEVVNLHYKYPDDQVHITADGRMGHRLTSLVFVELDDGLRGVGSAYSHPDLIRIIVEDHLAPLLVGQDPTQIAELWDRMYSLTRWYGRKGAAISALGAIDTALWDLRGKIERVPVHRLLGAKSTGVYAYASGLMWQNDLSLLVDEANRHLNDGFGLMKMRLGREPAYDREAVLAVTRAISGRARLAVDGTHRYSVEGAVELGAFLAEQNVAWFEEPFPPEDIDSYAILRSQVRVPVSAGENEFGVQGFRELFRVGAVDIAQPDVSRAGGITECVKIGRLAQESGIKVVSHTWSDAVALVANAHVIASLENGTGVEVDRTGSPFMDELLTEAPVFRSGQLQLSERPGLGIEVDKTMLRKFTLARGLPIPAGNYADLVFGTATTYTPVPTTTSGSLPVVRTVDLPEGSTQAT